MKATSYSLYDNNRSLLHDPRTWLILLAFCEKNIVRYVLLILTMVTGTPEISEGILAIAYIALIWACLRRGSKFHLGDFALLSFVVLSIAFTCLLYPENKKFIFDENNFWNSIFPCLRFFIVGLFIIPDRKLIEFVGVVSCFSVLVEIVFLFAYLQPRGLVESDDMSRSYQILLNVLFVLNSAFNKRTLPWIGISLASLLYIFSLGTRGPLVIILVFMFLKYIESSHFKRMGKILLGLTAGGLITLLSNSNYYILFLGFLKTLLDQLGVSARIIDLAIEGEMIAHTSGRDEIYDLALKKLSQQPSGYGVYGEWPWNGWNIHNMYLELLLHYGVILGAIIILWMFFITFKTYFKSKNNVAKEIVLMSAVGVFVRGIFGGSYLQLYTFLLIGFCFAELRRTKIYKLYD